MSVEPLSPPVLALPAAGFILTPDPTLQAWRVAERGCFHLCWPPYASQSLVGVCKPVHHPFRVSVIHPFLGVPSVPCSCMEGDFGYPVSLLYGQKAPILGVPTHSTLEDRSCLLTSPCPPSSLTLQLPPLCLFCLCSAMLGATWVGCNRVLFSVPLFYYPSLGNPSYSFGLNCSLSDQFSTGWKKYVPL